MDAGLLSGVRRVLEDARDVDDGDGQVLQEVQQSGGQIGRVAVLAVAHHEQRGAAPRHL